MSRAIERTDYASIKEFIAELDKGPNAGISAYRPNGRLQPGWTFGGEIIHEDKVNRGDNITPDFQKMHQVGIPDPQKLQRQTT